MYLTYCIFLDYMSHWSISRICQKKKKRHEEEKKLKSHQAIRPGDHFTVDEPLPAETVQGPICGLVPPAVVIALPAC